MDKTITWIADLHVGSRVGLTTEPENEVQEQLLHHFDREARGSPESDILVVNGDAVDGPDTKGHTAGIQDLNEQDKQAAELIARWPAKEIILVSGTPYHVGDATQHEENVANLLRAAGKKVVYVYSLDVLVNGWFRIFARHFVGSSGVPQGRGTAPERSKMWKHLNAGLKHAQPPNLCVFAHVHYYNLTDNAFGATVTLPCWQGPGGRFGESKCDGHIDIGLFRTVIGSNKSRSWSWEKTLYPVEDPQRLLQR